MPCMNYRKLTAVLLTVLESISAVVIPSNSQILRNDLFEDLLPLNLTAGPGVPTCSKVRYGGSLRPLSCKNALDKIERSSVPKRYGLRSSPAKDSFDYLVPERYLSDDGLCAIDVAIRQMQVSQGRKWDIANGVEISDAAWAVMRQCGMYGDGGSVDRFTTHNAIAIIMREYEPTVDCEPQTQHPVPDYRSCQFALQTLPASRYSVSFVSSDYPRPPRGVTRLPQEYVDSSGEYAGVCHIVFTMASSPTPTRMMYREAWEAAVAINTMCVQHSMLGTVRDLAALIDTITRKTFVRHQSAPFHDTYERSCKLQDHVLQTTGGSSRAAPRFLKLTSLPVKKPKKTMAHGVKTVNIT